MRPIRLLPILALTLGAACTDVIYSVLARIPRSLLWTSALLALVHPMPPLEAQERPAWADSMYALIQADLERLATMQRDHYARHQSFATDLGTLDCDASAGVTLSVAVSKNGYFAMGTHGRLGPSHGCLVYHGDAEPPSFPLTPSAPDRVECTPGAPALPVLLDGEDPMSTPALIPHDTQPLLANARYVVSALEREYPSELRDHWVAGTVDVVLYVCEQGTVRVALLSHSSGHKRMDDAALRVARTMKFNPALLDGHPVGVWVTLPIRFRPS